MEEDEASADGTNCTNYNTPEYIAIAAVNSAIGGISFIGCLLVIGLIILFKKYLFFNQRLILYLTIAAALNTLSMLTEATVYYPQTEAFNEYCRFSGFFQQVAGWAQLLAISCITIELFLKVVLKWQTNKLHIEAVILIVIFVFPLSFNWVPFTTDAYGLSGPWCWIKYYNKNCTDKDYFGLAFSIVLWYGPIYPILLILSLLYIIILISIWYQKYHYEGMYDPERLIRRNLMFKEVRPLLWYPLIFLIIEIFPSINRIYDIVDRENETPIPLWWLHAIITPLEGGLIAAVYAIDPETRKRLRWRIITMYLMEWFCRKRNIRDYDFENEGISDSLLSQGRSLSTHKSLPRATTERYGTESV